MASDYDPMQTGEVLDAIDRIRAEVVAIARAEIGDHQRDSDRVRGYFRQVLSTVSESEIHRLSKDLRFQWCGIFVLACYQMAGLTDVDWRTGKGGFGFVYPQRLPQVKTPEPGDCFVGPAHVYHHGLIVARGIEHGHMMLRSVEGNTPNVRERYRAEPRGYTYFSIAPWIKAKLGLYQ